jgi:hypothetical protein
MTPMTRMRKGEGMISRKESQESQGGKRLHHRARRDHREGEDWVEIEIGGEEEGPQITQIIRIKRWEPDGSMGVCGCGSVGVNQVGGEAITLSLSFSLS